MDHPPKARTITFGKSALRLVLIHISVQMKKVERPNTVSRGRFPPGIQASSPFLRPDQTISAGMMPKSTSRKVPENSSAL